MDVDEVLKYSSRTSEYQREKEQKKERLRQLEMEYEMLERERSRDGGWSEHGTPATDRSRPAGDESSPQPKRMRADGSPEVHALAQPTVSELIRLAVESDQAESTAAAVAALEAADGPDDADALENDTELEPLDESGVRKILALFVKRMQKNREMRIKFVDEADKFMESELELFESIQELSGLANSFEFFGIFLEMGIFKALIDLCSHENSDVTAAAISVLNELIDETSKSLTNQNRSFCDSLIDDLLKHQILALLWQNLDRFNEQQTDDIEAVHDTLSIFETLFELRSDVIKDKLISEKFLKWLMRRIRMRSNALMEANKLYASELICIILQQSEHSRVYLGKLNGIDVLLNQIAHFKRHNPTTVEQIELMQNIFNALCCSLLEKANCHLFLKGEGIQLMNLLLRENKIARNCSLKVLDYAFCGSNGVDNCNKFVEVLGLRTIFPLLMKRPSRNVQKVTSIDEYEEHIISCLSSLMRNCHSVAKERIMRKFTENDYEKVDRLMEYYFKYVEKVDRATATVARKKSRGEDADYENGDDDALDQYMTKLDNGFFTLQMIDLVIAELFCTHEGVRRRIQAILMTHKSPLKKIIEVLDDYLRNFGDNKSNKNWVRNEKVRIQNLIFRLTE